MWLNINKNLFLLFVEAWDMLSNTVKYFADLFSLVHDSLCTTTYRLVWYLEVVKKVEIKMCVYDEVG